MFLLVVRDHFRAHTEPQEKLQFCIFYIFYYVFIQSTKRLKALDSLVVSITRIQSPLNFPLN
jgi:hypothetical protein